MPAARIRSASTALSHALVHRCIHRTDRAPVALLDSGGLAMPLVFRYPQLAQHRRRDPRKNAALVGSSDPAGPVRQGQVSGEPCRHLGMRSSRPGQPAACAAMMPLPDVVAEHDSAIITTDPESGHTQVTVAAPGRFRTAIARAWRTVVVPNCHSPCFGDEQQHRAAATSLPAPAPRRRISATDRPASPASGPARACRGMRGSFRAATVPRSPRRGTPVRGSVRSA